jgi:hypothetical protein
MRFEEDDSMSANYFISEISTNKMVLDRVGVKRKTVLSFVTPSNWEVLDEVAMQANISPYDVRVEDDKLIVNVSPEPPNEWKRAFYFLLNKRTKDWVTVDFDSVEGFEQLAAEAKLAGK